MKESDIVLTGVTKIFSTGWFRKKIGVKDLSFSIERGEAVGLLGPNGSGKSTTIKMMIGFLKPTFGEIKICGRAASDRASHEFIGYLPENPRFQRFLTGREVLRYYGQLLGLGKKELEKRVDYLLTLVHLKSAARERVRGYSKGMVQRLAMAQALLSFPRLLVFDEPMSGLDPLGRMEIRNLIRDVHQEMNGTTIFFSTHILSDVEQVCTSVVLLKQGSLTRQCSIDELLGRDKPTYEVITEPLSDRLVPELSAKFEIRNSPLGASITIGSVDGLVDHLNWLRDRHVTVLGVYSRRPSLEASLFAESQMGDLTKLNDLGGQL